MPATHGRIQVRAWLDSFASKRGKRRGGQKTPPYARANRRGRNREEAKSTGKLTDYLYYVNLFLVIFTKIGSEPWFTMPSICLSVPAAESERGCRLATFRCRPPLSAPSPAAGGN